MKYEFNQQDLYQLASFIGAETKDDGEEVQFKLCPYCHGGASKDKYTFAVNRENGRFNCLRASCGKRGHFVTLARDMDYALNFGIVPKEYRRLPQREITLRPMAAKLLTQRGLSPEICDRYRITVQKNQKNVLVFPFYNPSGELVTVKYRNATFRKGIDKSKEWFEAGTQPILFGMQEARDFDKPLVITEGQIDALSLAECGVPNAVSVPNGCSAFTWIPHCYDWVMRFPSLVVMGDCEDGTITLVDRIAKSFKLPISYVPPESYFGLKDANDILREYGKEVLLESFQSAKEYILPHIRRLADVETIDFSTQPRIRSGIQRLDDLIGGFYFGQVILLTGRRGEGKSTLMGQLILEAIDQGHTVLAYSGELTASHFKNWLDFQAAGNEGVINLGTLEHPMYRVKPEAQQKINDWYRARALLYDNEAAYDDELEDLLGTVEDAVVRYGIRMVCIDNLMTAMDAGPREDFYRAQSEFVRKLKKLAIRYQLVVLLVAHPRKESGKDLDNDSVSGSGDITNRVDTVLIYSREAGENARGSALRVTKNRINGKLITNDPIRLVYSESSKRISPLGNSRYRRYGWETDNAWEDLLPPGEDLPF